MEEIILTETESVKSENPQIQSRQQGDSVPCDLHLQSEEEMKQEPDRKVDSNETFRLNIENESGKQQEEVILEQNMGGQSANLSPLTLREAEENITRPLSPSQTLSPARGRNLDIAGKNSSRVHHSPLPNKERDAFFSDLVSPKKTDSASPKKSSPKDANDDDEENCCLICMDDFTERRRPYPLPCTGTCNGNLVHYRCIMAWLSQSGSCPLCRSPCDPLSVQPSEMLDFTLDAKCLVTTPVSLDAGIIRCYVKQVNRGLFKQYGYEMYIQAPIHSTTGEDKFLLSARKQIRSNMTTNYIIATDKDCTDKNRVGRMGANFLGTVFTIYDNGCDPQKVAKVQDHLVADIAPSSTSSLNSQNTTLSPQEAVSNGTEDTDIQTNVLQIREELGCITYEANRTSVGPRKMRVCIPEVDEVNPNLKKIVKPMSRRDRLVHRLNTGDLRDLRRFTNREPVFREDLGAYCLDFGGRVSMASVKNFQLICEEDPSMGNILQFGRISQDTFTMDFQFPLSPLQAFAICLSSCDTKLACV